MSLTLKEMIAIGENQLINAGVMNPKVDAELLYMDMRGIDMVLGLYDYLCDFVLFN